MRANNIAANNLQGAATDSQSRATLSAGVGAAGPMSFPATWELGGDSRASYATSRYIEQVIHSVFIANEYWSQADFDSMTENPWQLLKPRRPVLYSFPSGGIVIPTLSLPGVQDVTTTGARPKVTLTF